MPTTRDMAISFALLWMQSRGAKIMKAISIKLLAAAFVAGAGFAGEACAGTLDQIRDSKAIRIAFREDSPPFSFKAANNQPAGFIVDLCQAVVVKLARQLNLPGLAVTYVPVTSVDRFDAIAQGKADLLCEATTATLSRRAIVDFSIGTFVDGASFAIRPDGPQEFKQFAGKKIGVLAGTTTETDLQRALKATGVTADIVVAKDHGEGIASLEKSGTVAYFADHAILAFLIKENKSPVQLMLANIYLSMEPFALAMRRGDEDFRLAVDRSLSQIYRTGEIVGIFNKTFGDKSKPSQILQTLYSIAALPE